MLAVGFIPISIWMLVATVMLIIAYQRSEKNEKRIMCIDEYLKARIMRETGQNLYKDLK